MTDIKGFFRIIALKKLAEGDKTGYDLIKSIESVLGKKPSAGSIYPLLGSLLEGGFVSFREEGRRKIYSITKEGRKKLKFIIAEKEKLLVNTFEFLSSFGLISDKNKLKTLYKLIEKMKSDGDLFLRNIDVWTEMHDTMMNLVLRDDYEKKQRAIRRVIKDTTISLRRLEK